MGTMQMNYPDVSEFYPSTARDVMDIITTVRKLAASHEFASFLPADCLALSC